MAVKIVLFQGDEKLAVELDDGKYIVGRDDRAEIIIPDSTVSSRHAEIEIRGDQVTVCDLGSSNGTFINGARLEGSSPNKITPSDDVQFGSSRISIELKTKDAAPKPVAPTKKMDVPAEPVPRKPAKASEPPKKAATPAARPAIKAPAKAPATADTGDKKGLSWTTRYWLAGAIALATVMLLMFFVEYYAESQDRTWRLASRYKTFAAQYVHVLGQEDIRTVPPPATDRSLLSPFRILDPQGRVLYPENLAFDEEGNPRVFSALIDPKTSLVRDRAKAGLYKVSIQVESGSSVTGYSFPVLSGGDLLGYVIARPGALSGQFGMRLAFVVLSTLLGLIVLFFAVQGPNRALKEYLELLSSKVSPLAAGFIDKLPRHGSYPEIGDLVNEFEKSIRRLKSSAGDGEMKGKAEQTGFESHMGALAEAAELLYCFIGGDFEILDLSKNLKSIREFGTARKDESIFDCGLSNVQSKQLVEAITSARSGEIGRSRLTLSLSGSSTTFDVTAQPFTEKGEQFVGLMFRPESP